MPASRLISRAALAVLAALALAVPGASLTAGHAGAATAAPAFKCDIRILHPMGASGLDWGFAGASVDRAHHLPECTLVNIYGNGEGDTQTVTRVTAHLVDSTDDPYLARLAALQAAVTSGRAFGLAGNRYACRAR